MRDQHRMEALQEIEEIVYKASKTASKFHRSNAFVRGIRGPVGGGKTVACCFDIFMRAHAQAPDRNGVRRSRWLCIRNTYGELKSTTIKTWDEWFGPHRGEGFGDIVYDVPIRQRIYLEYEDDADVDLEVWFVSMDRPKDVKKALSLEVTGIFLNEAAQLSEQVLDVATQRAGRFPPQKDRPDDLTVDEWPTWYGVIADTNSMDEDHWWYQKDEIEKPDGYEFFTQPGGLDPEAENLENLPGGRNYYHKQMEGKSQYYIDIYINNKYGKIFPGKPVYKHEWNAGLHIATNPLTIMRGLPLYLGWDFGLNPSLVIAQLSQRGQLRVIDELIGPDMGLKQFVLNLVKPHMATYYQNMPIISTGDPGGNQRSQNDSDRVAIGDLKSYGLPTRPAHTNAIMPRLDAVREFLTKLVDGEPGLVIDAEKCPVLVDGFNGGYQYRKLEVPGEDRYTMEPNKNQYSHPHDALQYLCLSITGVRRDYRREQRVNRNRRERRVPEAGY